MMYTGFFPDSRFPIPDSRFPIPDSLLPTPYSLKSRTFYLTQLITSNELKNS
ncbi:hypothetical protein [Moorena producens]|uniref:hypothetical protein n=1 Tax=Moorena producens TaxID=1155739 RepID=UPI003C77B991